MNGEIVTDSESGDYINLEHRLSAAGKSHHEAKSSNSTPYSETQGKDHCRMVSLCSLDSQIQLIYQFKFIAGMVKHCAYFLEESILLTVGGVWQQIYKSVLKLKPVVGIRINLPSP